MNTKINSYRLDTKKVKVLQIQRGIQNLGIVACSGFSAPEISRHVQGDGRRLEVQQAIADALGVPLDSILQKPTTADQQQAAA